jgi:hypothetical protein
VKLYFGTRDADISNYTPLKTNTDISLHYLFCQMQSCLTKHYALIEAIRVSLGVLITMLSEDNFPSSNLIAIFKWAHNSPPSYFPI